MFHIKYFPGRGSFFSAVSYFFIVTIVFLIKCKFDTPVFSENLPGIYFVYSEDMKEFEIKDFVLNICMRIILVKAEAAVKRCSVKEVFLKTYGNLRKNHLRLSLFLIKLGTCNSIEQRPKHRCFSENFAKLLKNTPFVEHLRTATSVKQDSQIQARKIKKYEYG